MRTVTIPSQTVTEAIQTVEHNIGAYVRVVVGVGSEVDGQFTFTVPQQFDTMIIENITPIVNSMTGEVIRTAITDYADLLAQFPDGNFSADDLWPYIDRVRARR